MSGYYKYTPLRLAIPFILGIALSIYFEIALSPFLLLMMTLFGFAGLIISFLFFKTNYPLRWVSGIMAVISLFAAGAMLIQTIDLKGKTVEKGIEISAGRDVFLCRIENDPAIKGRIFSCRATILAIKDSSGQYSQKNESIMVYFKDSLSSSLTYGDMIVISGKRQIIPAALNPHMFNYKKYLNNRQVYQQVFVETGFWQKTGKAECNPLFYFADRCRKTFLETFRRFDITGQNFALVSALLLGNSEFLDAEIRQEFSYAGATHVLSVSGLHVGIVYVAAEKMLFFLKRNRKTRKLHTLLSILCIWLYALISGLSTSVVRASLMFSLVAAGNLLKRSSEGYNILAVAAFLQLWINPYEITQVGFQLSYLAVLGIFAFYRPFNEIIESRNRIVAWIWPVIAVSLAAQLATSPLASHYFNMFPVYFLLTNLIVVPLAGLVIYLAVFLLLAGALDIILYWMALPLKWSLELMRGSVEMIQSWPGAVIEPIFLTGSQVMLLYLILMAVFAFLVLNQRRWIFVALGSIILLISLSAVRHYENLRNHEIIVYNIPGRTGLDMIRGKNAFFITDSIFKADDKKISFQVKPNRIAEGVNEIRTIESGRSDEYIAKGTWIKPPFIFFEGKRIVMINDQCKWLKNLNAKAFDLGIISGSAKIRPEEIILKITVKSWIIDSSVPFYKASQFASYCRDNNIQCHSVRHEGAYVMKW